MIFVTYPHARSDVRNFLTSGNGCFQSPFNLVPRVFSLSNMAAPGEETLAHSRNHVTDLSKNSGNLFKMAANIKSERIWVGGLETGEKQTKWRQRQTQKKLKMWKNALTSHRNTVEWYSDLIFCSMTFICFKPERSVAYTALNNCLQLNFSIPTFLHCFLFLPTLSARGSVFFFRERGSFF